MYVDLFVEVSICLGMAITRIALKFMTHFLGLPRLLLPGMLQERERQTDRQTDSYLYFFKNINKSLHTPRIASANLGRY